MLSYTSAMCSRLGDDLIYYDASKILLVVTFIFLCIRMLNFFSMSEVLGPKLVMIQKMVSVAYFDSDKTVMYKWKANGTNLAEKFIFTR